MQSTQCNQVSGRSSARSFAKVSHVRYSVHRAFLSVSLALAVTVLLSGCVDPEKTRQFPVERTLRSNDGRELPALLLSRTEDNVQIERISDKVKLNVKLDLLSPEDRRYLADFPITDPTTKAAVHGPKKRTSQDSYVTFREKRIAAVQKEIDDIYKKRGGGHEGTFIPKSASDIVEQKQKKILRLQEEITTYLNK